LNMRLVNLSNDGRQSRSFCRGRPLGTQFLLIVTALILLVFYERACNVHPHHELESFAVHRGVPGNLAWTALQKGDGTARFTLAGIQKTSRAEADDETAAAASAAIFQKVANAASAGCISAVILAAMFAITEPIANRVTVKRMTLPEAMKDVSPADMWRYFGTTLPTRLLKAPLYEALVTFMMTLALPANLAGTIIALTFVTLTMPITNYSARMSLQQDFGWKDMYVAFWPTVLRDTVGGIARVRATKFGIQTLGWAPQTPMLMAFAMLCTCAFSSPLNEWRGYLLQKGDKQLTFREFFKPWKCIRSTVIGCLQFSLALGAGYYIAPSVTGLVSQLLKR